MLLYLAVIMFVLGCYLIMVGLEAYLDARDRDEL